MRVNYTIYFIVLLVSGCSSTVELNSVDEARKAIGDQTGILCMHSGQEYKGRDIQVGKDSVRFINIPTENTLQYSTLDIKFIKVTDHTLGAFKGCLIGGAFMFAVVSIIKTQNDNSEHDGSGWTSGMKKNFPIIGAGIGSLIGIIIGGVSGHHYTYTFPEDSVEVGKGTSIDRTISPNQQILKSAP